jgi:hypothetical protein
MRSASAFFERHVAAAVRLRGRVEPTVRFPVRQSSYLLCHLNLGLPDIFKVTGTPTESPARLVCVRQIILKILRQIIFKMTGKGAGVARAGAFGARKASGAVARPPANERHHRRVPQAMRRIGN